MWQIVAPRYTKAHFFTRQKTARDVFVKDVLLTNGEVTFYSKCPPYLSKDGILRGKIGVQQVKVGLGSPRFPCAKSKNIFFIFKNNSFC